MGPKKDEKQKQVQKKTDDEILDDSLKQLYAYLAKQVDKQERIQLSLEETIRNIWETSGLHVLKDDLISDLCNILVSGGRKYCNRLSESTFCLLLHIALRADGALAEAQQIIYILANSLQYTKATQEDNLKRREKIAEHDFYALINYFTNMENEGLMRRWVGLLLIILLRGSGHNLRMLEDCPEAVCRQGIGRLIIHETDNFVKTVAGKLIAIANEGGMETTALWPNDVAPGLYRNFPAWPKYPEEWPENFAVWLHDLKVEFPGPDRIGQMSFVNTIRYCEHKQSREGPEVIYQNAVIFISDDIVSFLVPSLNTAVDQILDISPLTCLETITVVQEKASQVKQMEIWLDLKSDESAHTFQNSQPITVNRIVVLVSLYWGARILAEFIRSYPTVKMVGYDSEVSDPKTRGRALSSDEISIKQGNQGLVISPAEAMQTPEPRSDSTRLESGPSEPRPKSDIDKQEEEQTVNEQAVKQRTLQFVKPKAKVPIGLNNRQAKGNDNANQKRTQLPSSRPSVKANTTQAITTGITGEPAAPESIQPKPNHYRQSAVIERKGLLQPKSGARADRPLEKNAPPKSKSKAAKTDGGKATLTASSKSRVVGTASKPKKVDEENGDYITSPDIHDASTSKVIASRATTSNDVSQGQKKRYTLHRPEISGTSNMQAPQKRNERYFLNQNPEPTVAQNLKTDVFDMPTDDMPTDDENNENKKTANTGAKSKTKAKGRGSTGKIEKKKATKASTAANEKKRQSAPAALDVVVAAPRSSQRAAPARAKVSLRGVVDVDDDDAMDIDDESQTLLRPEATRPNKNSLQTKTKGVEDEAEVEVVENDLPHLKSGFSGPQIMDSDTVGAPKLQQDMPPPQATSEFIVVEMPKHEQLGAKVDLYHDHNDKVTNRQPENDEIERLRQEDARQLGLSQQDSELPDFEDNLNDDNTEKIPKELSPKPQPIVATKNQNSIKKVNSNASIADKLNIAFEKLPTDNEAGLSQTVSAPLKDKNSQPEAAQSAARAVPKNTKDSQSKVTQPLMQPAAQIKARQSVQEPIVISSPSDQSGFIEYIHRLASQPADQFESASGKDEAMTETKSVPRVENTQNAQPYGGTSSQENATLSSGAPAKIDSSTLSTEMVTEATSEKIITQAETSNVLMAERISFKESELPVESVAQVDLAARQVAEPTTSRSLAQVDTQPDADIQQVTDTNLFEDESKIKRKADVLENVGLKKPRKSDPQTFQVQDTRTLQKVARASKNLQPSPVPASKPALQHLTTNKTSLPSGITSQALREATTEVKSVGKDRFRKPRIIAFSRDGPLNQGKPGSDKSSAFKDARVTKGQDSQERKRKRNHRVALEPASPPKKRQESSPIYPNNEYEDDEPMCDSSPVVIATTRLASTRSRSNRQSLQPSRVDRNGSPVANEKVDHFEKLKERLSQEAIRDKVNDHESTLFGPKVQLGAKRNKAQNSSPEEVTSRYIAHERTRNGEYKEVGSKEVIAPERIVVDPFLDKNRKMSKSSDFTERLLKGASAPHEDSNDLAQLSQNDGPQLAVKNPQPSRGDAREQGFADANQRGRSDRLRHGVEDSGQHHERSHSGDLTGSSGDSRNSGVSGEAEYSRALRDVWNLTIRPHYSNTQHAIHTVAEEVITRLSNEEERMHRIVGQYNENGTKVLDKLDGRRENEKQILLKQIDVKSKELLGVYADAKEYIQEQVEELRENPIAEFQESWTEKQEDTQGVISAGTETVRL